MNLLAAARAAMRLAPQYRCTREVSAASRMDSKATLDRELGFGGGEAPSLSGREYPYRNHSTSSGDYSFRVVEDLVQQLVSRGLKRIRGDIVGDDRRYIWAPFADGWTFGDSTGGYGAAVSWLILDDNGFAMTIRPGAHAGDLAHILLLPPFEYFCIDNRVRTEERCAPRIDFDR